MYDDIPWDDLFETELEDTTQDIEEIMYGYCDGIRTGSKGTVEARFVELKMAVRANGIGTLAATLTAPQEYYQSNALAQKNINEVYRPKTYVFDIYNKTYQFRLFELTYGVKYPIEIKIDEDVEDEIRKSLRAQYESQEGRGSWMLANDTELQDCFKLMITCSKARQILSQLRQG